MHARATPDVRLSEREARAPAAVLSFVIFRTHLDKAKHYKRLWVFIYIGSFLRHAPTPLMGVGQILWVSSVVIGIPFVVFKLDRKISHNDCKNGYAWTLSGTVLGTPGVFFFIASIPFTSSLSREAASILMSSFTGMVLIVQIPILKRCFPPFNGEHVRWKYFVPLSFYFFEVAQAMCFLGTDVTMPEFCAWSIARCLPRRILTPTSLARRRRPQFCAGDVLDLPQPRLPSRDVERDIGRALQPRRRAAFRRAETSPRSPTGREAQRGRTRGQPRGYLRAYSRPRHPRRGANVQADKPGIDGARLLLRRRNSGSLARNRVSCGDRTDVCGSLAHPCGIYKVRAVARSERKHPGATLTSGCA